METREVSLGAAVRRVRQSKRLTQKEVGSRAGLAMSYVSRIENGHIQPTAATIGRLAGALEVATTELFARPGELPEPGQRCPVSSSGECIGRLIREQHGLAGYSEEELRLLRMTDYLMQEGGAQIRTALATLLEALMRRVQRR
ncbi:MAG: helix-turn-helix domain-containing protein [Planctomycetota bacterium]